MNEQTERLRRDAGRSARVQEQQQVAPDRPDGDDLGNDTATPHDDLARELGRGRSTRTPFVLFFGVNLALLGLALVIALIALLVVLLWRVA